MYSFDIDSSKAFKVEDHTNDLDYWSRVGLRERLVAAY